MTQKTKLITYLVIGFATVTLGCETITNLASGAGSAPTATPAVLPASAFVPPNTTTQGFVNQPLVIESQYDSIAEITEFEILVNDQTVELLQTGAEAADFQTELAGTSSLLLPSSRQGLFLVRKVEPPVSSSAKKVSLTWIATTPGTYNLTIKVKDAGGNENETAQMVEIVTP